MHLYENKRSVNRSLVAAGAVFLALILLFGLVIFYKVEKNFIDTV